MKLKCPECECKFDVSESTKSTQCPECYFQFTCNSVETEELEFNSEIQELQASEVWDESISATDVTIDDRRPRRKKQPKTKREIVAQHFEPRVGAGLIIQAYATTIWIYLPFVIIFLAVVGGMLGLWKHGIWQNIALVFLWMAVFSLSASMIWGAWKIWRGTKEGSGWAIPVTIVAFFSILFFVCLAVVNAIAQQRGADDLYGFLTVIAFIPLPIGLFAAMHSWAAVIKQFERRKWSNDFKNLTIASLTLIGLIVALVALGVFFLISGAKALGAMNHFYSVFVLTPLAVTFQLKSKMLVQTTIQAGRWIRTNCKKRRPNQTGTASAEQKTASVPERGWLPLPIIGGVSVVTIVVIVLVVINFSPNGQNEKDDKNVAIKEQSPPNPLSAAAAVEEENNNQSASMETAQLMTFFENVQAENQNWNPKELDHALHLASEDQDEDVQLKALSVIQSQLVEATDSQEAASHAIARLKSSRGMLKIAMASDSEKVFQAAVGIYAQLHPRDSTSPLLSGLPHARLHGFSEDLLRQSIIKVVQQDPAYFPIRPRMETSWEFLPLCATEKNFKKLLEARMNYGDNQIISARYDAALAPLWINLLSQSDPRSFRFNNAGLFFIAGNSDFVVNLDELLQLPVIESHAETISSALQARIESKPQIDLNGRKVIELIAKWTTRKPEEVLRQFNDPWGEEFGTKYAKLISRADSEKLREFLSSRRSEAWLDLRIQSHEQFSTSANDVAQFKNQGEEIDLAQLKLLLESPIYREKTIRLAKLTALQNETGALATGVLQQGLLNINQPLVPYSEDVYAAILLAPKSKLRTGNLSSWKDWYAKTSLTPGEPLLRVFRAMLLLPDDFLNQSDRQFVLAILAKADRTDIRPILQGMLHSSSRVKQAHAAYALCMAQDDEAIQSVVNALKQDDQQAIEAVLKVAGSNSEFALLERLQDSAESEAVQLAVYRILLNIGTTQSSLMLSQLMQKDQKHSELIGNVFSEVSKRVVAVPNRVSLKAISPSYTALDQMRQLDKSTPIPVDVKNAIESLSEPDQRLIHLIHLSESTLKENEASTVAEAVKKLTEDESLTIRHFALLSLARASGADAIPVLSNALKNGNHYDALSAATALAEISTTDSLLPLVELLRNPDQVALGQCALILAATQNQTLVEEQLTPLIESDDLLLAYQAQHVLDFLKDALPKDNKILHRIRNATL